MNNTGLLAILCFTCAVVGSELQDYKIQQYCKYQNAYQFSKDTFMQCAVTEITLKEDG